MNYGDYRDYNRDLANDRICAAIDRHEEFPPDDEEDEGNEEDETLVDFPTT
jgi:hypothetical protein